MLYLRISGEIIVEKKIVLIITCSVDETASYIVKKYSNVATFFRVNVDKFGEYEFVISNKDWRISNECHTVSSGDIYSIYYRKPMLPDLSTYDSQYHLMMQRDIISIINGIADSFEGKVLTKPSILRKTENKIYQLLYTGKNGWNVPNSYIGNSCTECCLYKKGESIIKPLTTGKTYGRNGWELYQTSIFRGIYEDIGLTPIYLQNYISKQFEVRITVIERKYYAVRIDTKNKIDWRADYYNHRYSEIICPDSVIQKCYQMMDDFSLNFGAFDFIVTPDDEWIFLEINPNGQWLWLEQKLGINISKKIVEYLVD